MENVDLSPHQTAMLIGRAQDAARNLGYTPSSIRSVAVVCGITYNGSRDMSVLDQAPLPREKLVNCAPVLDEGFFQEAERMMKDTAYRKFWLEKYQKEIQPMMEPV